MRFRSDSEHYWHRRWAEDVMSTRQTEPPYTWIKVRRSTSERMMHNGKEMVMVQRGSRRDGHYEYDAYPFYSEIRLGKHSFDSRDEAFQYVERALREAAAAREPTP